MTAGAALRGLCMFLYMVISLGVRPGMCMMSVMSKCESKRHKYAPTALHLQTMGTMSAAQGKGIGRNVLQSGIKRADAEVGLARAEIKARRAQAHPDVFLRFERQINDLQLAGQGSNSRVLVGVRSQLGAGLSSFSGVAQARESIAAARANRRSAELSIREQIRADFALLKSFELRLPALEEAARTSTQVYESYQRQFLTGRKSWLDVMNSARDLQQARLQLADVTAGRLTLAWRLYVLSNPMATSLRGRG